VRGRLDALSGLGHGLRTKGSGLLSPVNTSCPPWSAAGRLAAASRRRARAATVPRLPTLAPLKQPRFLFCAPDLRDAHEYAAVGPELAVGQQRRGRTDHPQRPICYEPRVVCSHQPGVRECASLGLLHSKCTLLYAPRLRSRQGVTRACFADLTADPCRPPPLSLLQVLAMAGTQGAAPTVNGSGYNYLGNPNY
jgi:hypothetical protein